MDWREAKRVTQSRRWRRFRAAVIATEPLCRRCAAEGFSVLAEHLHHVRPMMQAPDLTFVIENVEPLCRNCHDEHHAGERGSPETREFRHFALELMEAHSGPAHQS